MSNYQGKRFKLSQIPDPANPGAPRPVQPGRTSSSQPVRPPQPAHVARHVRAPQPVAPSNQRVQGALPTCPVTGSNRKLIVLLRPGSVARWKVLLLSAKKAVRFSRDFLL